MQAYILVSGKQDKIISHQTMKQVAKLESKTNKVDNIRNTTSIVSLMNQELKSSASSSLISQSGSDSSKLQTDIMANLTSKQKQDLQTKLQASLTTDQTAQITQFTTTILTTEQKAAMAQGGSTADLTSSLSADQQTKVSAYTMSILTTDQQAAYKKLIIADLPSVEKMSTPLLRDLMLDSNGNVRSQLKSLLPKNGKHLLIMATTSDKADMTT
ncbi:MAG: RND family transporter, partial [Leuconostoc falkenbergense]